MKNLYILPASNGESNSVAESLTRAGVRYVEIEALHELWPHVVDTTDVVVRIPDNILVVLVRHMSTLLGEPPVRIDSAPGSKYTYEWNTATASLPSEVWDTLEGRFAKSGLLAHTSTQVEERTKLTAQGHKADKTPSARERMRSNGTTPQRGKSEIDLATLDDDDGSDVDAILNAGE
jgi:hypothetical protein